MESFDEIVKDFGEQPDILAHDEMISAIKSRAQSFNEQLEASSLPLPKEALQKEVDCLNQQLKAYVSQTNASFAVSGDIYFGVSYQNQSPMPHTDFVECDMSNPVKLFYYPIASVGFAFTDRTIVNEKGDFAVEQCVVFVSSIDLQQPDDDRLIDICAVKPEGLTIMPKGESFITRSDIHPKLQEHLTFMRDIVSQADSHVDTVLNLRDAQFIPNVGPAEDEEYHFILNECLATSIRFHDDIPYIAEVEGEMDEYEPSRMENQTRFILTATKLLLTKPELSVEQRDGLSSQLVLKALWIRNQHNQTTVIKIPLMSLKDFASTAEFYKDLLT